MSIKLRYKKQPKQTVILIGARYYNKQGLLFRFADAGGTFKILIKDLKHLNDIFEDCDIIKM